MARKKRSKRLNICHHVMLKGIDGKNIFNDDADRCRFCLLLQFASEEHKFIIHGFCFMSNHVHLVLEPTVSELQKCVHLFAFRYAQYFNRRHKRRGYLFQGRFRSILVEEGTYLRRLIRYVHLNPLEAYLVKKPGDYKWSSHNAYLGTDKFEWLKTDRVLSRFASNKGEAIRCYLEFMNHKLEAEMDKDDIYKASRKGVFGSEEFEKDYEDEQEFTPSPKHIKKLDVTLVEAVDEICGRFKVEFIDLVGSSKMKCIVDARSVIALLGRTADNLTMENVASVLEKHNGTIAKLASRAEKDKELKEIVDSMFD